MKPSAVALVLLVLLVLSSCATPPADEGAARVGGRVITLAEVDARWREIDPSTQLKTQQALYDGRRDALDLIMTDALLADAARSRGVTVQEYLADEMSRRLRPVTADDVQAFYNENQARLQGQSLDDVRGAIGELLQSRRQAEARAALLAELRKSSGSVTINLEPPRQKVDVLPGDPARGPRSAPVTIVEFSDYQCPFCARVTPVLAKVRATYGDRVRIVWKDFPLEEIHSRAAALAEAARCAGEQGKYWEFHDSVFANQSAAATRPLEEYARELGIRSADFLACTRSRRHVRAVTDGQDAGNMLGVSSTPTLFINGRTVTGAQPFEVMARVIDDELARKSP